MKKAVTDWAIRNVPLISDFNAKYLYMQNSHSNHVSEKKKKKNDGSKERRKIGYDTLRTSNFKLKELKFRNFHNSSELSISNIAGIGNERTKKIGTQNFNFVI